MTSIFIQIMTIKSAGLWEEQSVFSRDSLIVTFFILLKTGVGKLQPVGQAKPTTCYYTSYTLRKVFKFLNNF